MINTLTCLDDRSDATSGPKQNLHAIIAASMFRRAQHKTVFAAITHFSCRHAKLNF